MGFRDQLDRPLRQGVAPLTTVILFAILLAYFFILYQPTHGPGLIQGLGRQAWEVVTPTPPSGKQFDDFGLPLKELPKPPGTHWWDQTTPAKPIDTAALPFDHWDPMLPHNTGLSEITVGKCMFPPWLVSVCKPKSYWQEEWKNGGQWVRVESDLNAKAGFWYLNLYYRRTRRFDVPLITNVTLLPSGGEEALLDEFSKWKKVPTSVRDGVPGIPPLYLWYKVGPSLQDYRQKNSTDYIITELDVTYGDGPAWFGFERIPTPVTPGTANKIEPVWMSYRRGAAKLPPPAPPLHFNPDRNGTYKIMQVADLHFSVGTGSCRDVAVAPCPNSDAMSATLLAKALDAEQPDLVVFTGDQLNGQSTSWHSRSVLAKFAKEVIKRRIPWATVLGNHDDEDDLDRKQLMEHISRMPFSVATSGPEDVDGAGNYMLKVKSGDASATHILTLYFLDSHGYITADFGLWQHITDYDYIRESQIGWFNSQSQNIAPILRPFRPDGANDLGHIGPRAKLPEQTLAKPNALMFFHIPLQETFFAADSDPKTGKALDMGSQLDKPSSSKKNDGFFEKALLSAKQGANTDLPEVKVVGNGHMHTTDNCRRVRGVWFCFGGGGSYSGYGRLGFDRRFRIYQISDWGETIRTYKRTEFDEIIDDVVLAGNGAWGGGKR